MLDYKGSSLTDSLTERVEIRACVLEHLRNLIYLFVIYLTKYRLDEREKDSGFGILQYYFKYSEGFAVIIGVSLMANPAVPVQRKLALLQLLTKP